MTEFAKGGYVPGKPLPPEYWGLHLNECLYSIDLKCVRSEHENRHKEEKWYIT